MTMINNYFQLKMTCYSYKFELMEHSYNEESSDRKQQTFGHGTDLLDFANQGYQLNQDPNADKENA